MGSEGLEGIRRHPVVTSHNGWLKAWENIVLDGEDWCDVRHGRLIIIPYEIGVKKNTVLSSCHHSFDS